MNDRDTTSANDRGVVHDRGRNSSPSRTISSFIPENLLPQDVTQLVQKVAANMSERSNSELDLPVFSPQPADEHDEFTETTRVASSLSEQEEDGNYDLKPPAPSLSVRNAESLAEQLFSADHLNLILADRNLNTKFTSFLNRYRPQANLILARYQATQKAKAAIQYANSIFAESLAEAIPSFAPAAIVDRRFEAESRKATEELISDALPAYVTHRLVGVVTECLVKEITGNNAPIMRDLIPGLAEIYCLTDPSVVDNPIVYASEEFYSTTQYGREYVIGRNCRFLQGPKSSHSSVKRLIDALASGTEVCETILNYRRDGTPFINLLMIAPLYDNKGRIRYNIGCQIDVTKLLEEGRGLESMHQLITQGRTASRFGNLHNSSDALGELGRQFSPMELDVIRNPQLDILGHTQQRPGTARRRFGMEDGIGLDRHLWPAASLGPSGRLPGVYQNYMLVRPYPSLRITFTSPAMRIPGLVQSRFMDRIGGAQHIREGILEALTQGVGVTARVTWLTHSARTEKNNTQGKPRWVHCTPLLGADEQVGVWMIVMVDKAEMTGSLHREAPTAPRPILMSPITSPVMSPIRSPSLATTSAPTSRSNRTGQTIPMSPMSDRHSSAKLYAQYLREGKQVPPNSRVEAQSRIDSARDSNSVDRIDQHDSDVGVLDF